MRAAIVLSGLCVAVVLAGCSPTTGGVTRGVPGDSPTPRLPRPGQAGGAGNVASKNMQYVCRGKETSGWVAVDYLDDAEACPTSRARFNTAVIVPLANTNPGSMLDVCADQRIPTDWHRVQSIVADPRCPNNRPSADPSVATVMTIQRDR